MVYLQQLSPHFYDPLMSRQYEYCNDCEVVKAKANPQKKKKIISNDVPNAYKMKMQ